MIDSVVAEGLALVRAGLDVLLSVELDGLGSAAVADLLESLEVERRRLDAVDARVVAEADQRSVAGEYGRTSTADLISTRCRVDPGEARRRVTRARVVTPRLAVSGGVLDPLLPATAGALVAGEIGAGHVDVIARTLDAVDHLPGAVELAPMVESSLFEAAGTLYPRALRDVAAVLIMRLDQGGAEPAEAARDRARVFRLRAGRPGRLLGDLTGECEAVWQAVLEPLAAPLPAADGTPDERTAGQRMHDAFLEAGRMILRSQQLPDTAGTPTTVLVRVDAEDLIDPAGVAQGAHGEPVPMSTVRQMLDETELGIVATDNYGQVLAYGRTRRLASPAQRRALALRDGGCSFPGCDRPPAWTQAHHVIAWLDGGPTDLTNLCLVCTHHHRLVERGDWTIAMTHGRPHWLPPPWLDPDQRPVLNHANHLPKIDFGVPDTQRVRP